MNGLFGLPGLLPEHGQSRNADADAPGGVSWGQRIPLGGAMGFRPASGRWIHPVGPINYTTQTLNVLTYAAIQLSEAGGLAVLAVDISGSVATATARLGVYSSKAGNLPDALLVDAGTVATATSGIKTIALTSALPLAAGQYFLAYVAQVASASVISLTSGFSGPITHSAVVTATHNSYSETGVSGALPATASPSVATLASAVAVWAQFS